MAELTPQERLQPALLDRLTDEEPDKTQESRERRVMPKSRFRQAVLRDLAWLFNSTRLSPDEVPKSSLAHHSVINFGLPALSGRSATSMDPSDVERAIRDAILDFEPRILPGSLRVRAVMHASQLDHHNVIGVEIQGQLWAQPIPIELLVRTEIDLESGEVKISDLQQPRAE
jgi:type VI secretion system protein ImpF